MLRPGPRTVLALLAAALTAGAAPALAAEPAPHEHGAPAAEEHGQPAAGADDHGSPAGADAHDDHGAPAEETHEHGRVAATPELRTRTLVVAGFLAVNAAIVAGAAAAGLRSPRPVRSRA